MYIFVGFAIISSRTAAICILIFCHSSANISLYSNTRSEDVLKLSDNDESTCLNVTRSNVTPSLIAQLHVEVPVENVPHEYLVIKVVANGLKCNASIVFYKVGGSMSDCHMKETQGKVGRPFWVVPNMGTCYFRIPVECEARDDFCQFNGVLVVSNTNGESAEICELTQG